MPCGATCDAAVSPPGSSSSRPPTRSPGAIDDASGVHAVSALVDALPHDQRVAFVLTQVVGCSYAEAAEACGVPIGTIRSRVARAREHLLETLRESDTG